FIYLGIIFFAAFIIKQTSRKVKIPEVTGYVLIGVLLGVSLLRILGPQVLDQLSAVSTVALGIIAFIIGVELRLDVIRKLGRSILLIVLFECLTTFFLVYLVLLKVFPGNPYMALLLGSVASATAPAATVAVIKQYRAKGDLTFTIMAVVGIDDALALIIFVFASGIVKAGLTGGDARMILIIGKTVLSIGESIALGWAAAWVLRRLAGRLRETEAIQLMLAAAVMALLGISEVLGNSELLAVMAFGSILVNTAPTLAKRGSSVVDNFSPLFLAAFFLLGGAHLDVRVLSQVGVMGLVYFAARSSGKIGGASLGAILGRAPKKVRKFIGLTLLPQVGVALALALSINKEFTQPQYGAAGTEMAHYIINILLFTTIITEIVGPLLTKFALQRTGEAKTVEQ
ncbi:MAG TPA: cation:proton antiporter, partial [Sediminispirochaeta sp.]|nr:cation:proton antiporter [Sediminispirochaeta sp.]